MATTASFGTFSRVELTAAAAAVTYVERTQIGKRPPLSPPVREAAGATLAIDQATRSNLELIRTLAGERRGSLLSAIDRTVTAAGSRLLAQRLAAPLTDPAEIAHRLDAVAAFVDDGAARGDLRKDLKAVPDLQRALSRIVIGRGGPRDLAAIRDGIFAAAEFSATVCRARPDGADLPRDLARAAAGLRRPDAALAAELQRALADELPAYRRDGGFVRAGYEPALDEARALRDESRRVIAALQVRYAETTGIRSLKIRHNNVLGYFVDVTAQNGEKLLSAPLNATFIHRQTTAGQVRFTTTELGELEAKIANAAERALALELEIFDRLAASVAAASAAIKEAADALAMVDVAAALASLAVERDYVRPEVDGSLAFAITGGRHPVVEQVLGGDGSPFVANDCDLSGRTHLARHRPQHGRQIDLPAPERAHCRAGADGELRAGANGAYRRGRPPVLARRRRRRSRPRTLDLHGRDGRDRRDPQPGRRARARHPRRDRPRHRDLRRPVHRLGDHRASAREQSLPGAVRHAFPRDDRARRKTSAAAQRHHAREGMAGRGRVPARSGARRRRPLLRHCQVAKLAGLPPSVIERAKLVLTQLEAQDRTSPAHRLIDDLPLFAAARPAAAPQRDTALTALVEALAALHPDEMSPRDALEALYALKAQLAKT